MRQFVAILLSLSLSWITTGYACEYAMGHATQNTCCCLPGQAEQCPSPEHCQTDAAQSGKACCDVISLNGIYADDKALTNSTVHDFQPLAPPPAALGHTLVLNVSNADPHPALADDSPPGWGTQTYLKTARLRI